MDSRRAILYAALVLIIYALWTSWHQDYLSETIVSHQGIDKANTNMLPDMPVQTDAAKITHVNDSVRPNEASKSGSTIQVITDVLRLTIDTNSGDIISSQLPDYPVSIADRSPSSILYTNGNERYVANSGLFIKSGQHIENLDFNFTSDHAQYRIKPADSELKVLLQGHTKQGIQVRKIFTFTRGSYLIDVAYQLDNNSNAMWQGYMNTQLLQTMPEEDKSSIFHVGSYSGGSYANPGKHRYQKVSFQAMKKNNLQENAAGGWVAMQQHYFLTAWIPEVNTKNMLYTRAIDDSYSIGFVSAPIVIEPNKQATVGAKLYVGPEITKHLKAIAPGLDLTVDYGWLWFLSSILFSIMTYIYNIVGNWGWSIVLVTVLIKLAFYHLSARSYQSMAGMRKLQPKLQLLRERYGDDKVKISQETMALYRQEKVNPLGGCLPIVIQIPVFIALYWVLLESVELRQAPFILWINDLASTDHYHVLPIIMGITMLIQQRLNPAPPDPMQAKIMMFLPILFTGLFWNFPAGLVLYWIVNNTLSILQQWYITRKYDESALKALPIK